MRNNIVTCDWVFEHLNDSDVRIIDTRFDLSNPLYGINEYIQGHIPGAFYFDLDKDLSSTSLKHGGRHPLPNIEPFVQKLSCAGIDETVKVVVYDEDGGMYSARFWWLLKYLGHDNIYILDGGFKEWRERGCLISQDVPLIQPKEFRSNIQTHMLVHIENVKEKMVRNDAVLLDARAYERFAGHVEPIDKKAGHIPGAQNAFWKNNYREDGKWKTIEELHTQYESLDRELQYIVYCGSGVSACPTIVALKEAGFKNVQLYVGSWSDWSSYDGNPIETK
ncbi:sulfurtransferase [Bacillus solimangrovi]|uniref:3-mercaptopyruvate sulfurtransferase n=1 Tax=Bacillus solimangrovi TaxID=1305675 RepID=A0A1E5LFX2_9BACI|nr:sulfurtransferase [Bacillus solimangrovi]OEH92971.1 3-mercaptopyruvate sulfurtransferase [Bacillus solimangrovi]